MKEIILIKNGELALKGLNRRNFEDALIKNIKGRLKSLGETEVRSSQSTIYIEPKSENYDLALRGSAAPAFARKQPKIYLRAHPSI